MIGSHIRFRRAAIDDVGSSTKSLTHAIQIISPLPWVAMVAVYMIVFVLIFWALFGSIPTYVTGQGVLIVKEGSIYSAVGPEGAGRVVRILVIPGDQVKKGQVVVQLDQADLRKHVAASNEHLQRLLSAMAELDSQAREKRARRKEQIRTQNEILQRMIATEEKNLSNLVELVEIKKISVSKGIESKENLFQAMTQLFASQSSIDAYQDRLTQNKIAESEYEDLWAQRLMEMNLKITDAQYDLKTLQERLLLSNAVRSPADGTVITLQAAIGDMVRGGSPVLGIASSGTGMDAIIFAPAQVGKRVKPGMPALVSPSTVKREEFGSIKGRVKTVSQFPTTKESMMAVLHNQHLVDYLSAEGPPITVRIQLTESPNTFSGYLWSSSQGPEQHISPGGLAEGRITVREQAPISLVIPLLKKLGEG